MIQVECKMGSVKVRAIKMKKYRIIILGMITMVLCGCTEGEVSQSKVEEEQNQMNNEAVDDSVVIGLSVDQEFESRIAVTDAIKSEAKNLGYVVEESIAEGDAQAQNAQIREFIEMDVNVILVCAVDQNMIEGALEEAVSAGIPIVAFDRNLPDSTSIEAYVGPDSIQDGKVCGEALIESLGNEEGTIYVLELVGALNDQNGIERSRGWNEAVAQMPQVEVIQVPTDWDEESAREMTINAFQANPDIRAVFCSTDSFVPNVNDVLMNMDKKYLVGEPNHIFINGVNGSTVGYEAVISGEIDGFMVMNLDEIGENTIEITRKIIEGESYEKMNLVESTYYTIEDAEDNKSEIWGAK